MEAIIHDWYIFGNIIMGNTCFHKTEDSKPIATSRIKTVREIAENLFEAKTNSDSTYYLMNVNKDFKADVFSLRDVSQNGETIDTDTLWNNVCANREKLTDAKIKDWCAYRPIHAD